MKKLTKILLLGSLGSVLGATAAFGQISFDEYGGAVGMPPGVLMPDPSGGIPPAVGPVLTYTLPFPTVSGDVLLTEEPGTNQTQHSDVVRFWNNTAGQSVIIFYSEQPENPLEIPPPADIGLPTQILPLFAGPYMEIGTDAFNYYDYLATPGMPGSVVGAPGPIAYHIISDGVVPEPATGALAGLGALLAVLKWRKRS